MRKIHPVLKRRFYLIMIQKKRAELIKNVRLLKEALKK